MTGRQQKDLTMDLGRISEMTGNEFNRRAKNGSTDLRLASH